MAKLQGPKVRRVLDVACRCRRLVGVRHCSTIVRRLLDWFSRNARDLPWRRTSDPYAVWVSEVMLQQTQVKTVIPYWERWMAALPDVAALAAADETRVLKLWEGLGYYRRARNLQAAAKAIRERHGGEFPRALPDLLELPGVGRYTAGAICSIAFNQPAAILDGNVIRVLTRLGAVRGDPREGRVRERLWREAGELVAAAAATGRKHACSHLNQALMELGATRCTPRVPLCRECPLAGVCRARAAGRPEAYPRTARRAAATAREYVVIVARVGGRLCVRQRPADGVNGGLWEFPNVEVTGAGAEEAPEKVARTLFGMRRAVVAPLAVVRHSITRYRITQRAFALEPGPEAARRGNAGCWLTERELDGLPFTRAHRRILESWRARQARLHSRSGSTERTTDGTDNTDGRPPVPVYP